MAGQSSRGTGPCRSVTEPSAIFSIVPIALNVTGWSSPSRFGPASSIARTSSPARLASESSRNWPEVTTSSPCERPASTSVLPPASRPIRTSAGMKPPSSCLIMTMVRRPVRITASEGTSRARRVSGVSETCANMPGLSRPEGLGNCARTVIVRLASCALGKIAMIGPENLSSGNAVRVALTGWPTRIFAACVSGTDASSQIGENPVISARVWPAITVMPGRTPSMVMAPPVGAVTVIVACARPVRPTDEICPFDMPSSRIRSRMACASCSSPLFRTARYSCCAPPHSGTRISASGAPRLTTSSGARP